MQCSNLSTHNYIKQNENMSQWRNNNEEMTFCVKIKYTLNLQDNGNK